jgi:DNA-binding response OmpR family regulator
MASVLVIDDKDYVRDVARRILESAGHQVLLARTGDEGLAVFRARPADLVLCDIYLPGRSGLEVIPELRRASPRVPVVAMTAGSFDGKFDLPGVAAERGAAATVKKPFTCDELLTVVDMVLRRPPTPRKPGRGCPG